MACGVSGEGVRPRGLSFPGSVATSLASIDSKISAEADRDPGVMSWDTPELVSETELSTELVECDPECPERDRPLLVSRDLLNSSRGNGSPPYEAGSVWAPPLGISASLSGVENAL